MGPLRAAGGHRGRPAGPPHPGRRPGAPPAQRRRQPDRRHHPAAPGQPGAHDPADRRPAHPAPQRDAQLRARCLGRREVRADRAQRRLRGGRAMRARGHGQDHGRGGAQRRDLDDQVLRPLHRRRHRRGYRQGDPAARLDHRDRRSSRDAAHSAGRPAAGRRHQGPGDRGAPPDQRRNRLLLRTEPRPGRLRGLLVDIGPLRELREFRLLWTGQLISMTGRQITLVAVAYQVYLLTGSTLAVGLLGLVQAVPLILAGLYAGALADRFDRRLVMLGSLSVLGLTSLALALAAGGRPSLWFIYAVSAVSAGVSTAEHSARSATVPRLVGPARLPAALTLTQVLFQFAVVAGPSAAGVVIAAAGLRWAYAIDVGCFALALVCVLLLRPLPAPPEGRQTELGWRAPAEALRYARGNPVLLAIFAADLDAMIFGMPRALFPALAAHLFRVGPQGLGLLYAAPGAGALVGSLLSGWASGIRRQGAAVLCGVAAG